VNELPLRDIHLPDAIVWWPLAIGWWALILLFLISCFVGYILIKKHQYKKQFAYRNFALNEINTLRKNLKNQNNSIELLRSVSALLRRTALSYLPRENIASLTGQAWFAQLNKLSSQTVFTPEIISLLELAPYQKKTEFNTDELLNKCEQWIKLLPETKLPEENFPGKNVAGKHSPEATQ